MKTFITGGTGFVGTALAKRLLERGDEITLCSSRAKSSFEKNDLIRVVKADTTKRGDWQAQLEKYDVIVNLAGRSVFNYWSESYKNNIYSSRIHTTRNIVEALPENSSTILLSASAAGYYGNGADIELDEASPVGTDFLADVCRNWEDEAFAATKKGARVATMRFGVVLGSQGGAIATMKTPFQLCLGGPIGRGSQWFPWIHIDDLVSAVVFLIDGSSLEGPFNFTAPETVRQKDFAKALGSFMHRPAILPAPSFIMKTVLGEFGQSLLQGQKVIPRALQESGFVFSYPTLDDALREILND